MTDAGVAKVVSAAGRAIFPIAVRCSRSAPLAGKATRRCLRNTSQEPSATVATRPTPPAQAMPSIPPSSTKMTTGSSTATVAVPASSTHMDWRPCPAARSRFDSIMPRPITTANGVVMST
ncbi:hypothetical protein D3C87_1870230 [compost metagenome]